MQIDLYIELKIDKFQCRKKKKKKLPTIFFTARHPIKQLISTSWKQKRPFSSKKANRDAAIATIIQLFSPPISPDFEIQFNPFLRVFLFARAESQVARATRG